MKAILRIIGILVIVVGTVLLGGCPQTSGGGETATLTIINNSSHTINEFYCTESTNSNWGADLLSGTIAPGGTQDFSIPAGTVDLDAEETTYSVYWDSYDEVFVSGVMYDWTLTDANATAYSLIGSWATTSLIEDAIGAGLDFKAGAMMVYGVGTYSVTYTVIDTNDADTEYNCSHSGTIAPIDIDSSTTLVATVVTSDGDGSDYYPLAGSDLQFIYSNLTATTVDNGTDIDNNGTIDFSMPLVRQ